MFKSAATKIAHNTTIPALAGNSDLRPLQDLITAEKTVLVSLQKLRTDLARAGDALRIWGQGEGADLGDILAASSTILAHFATALSTYSNLHHTVRDSMKSVRTREEILDDLRRRRRRVGASAEAAEKKLHKMSPEHKNLGAQTDLLNKLREEMRTLDGEIVREEAELGDYKRKCAKDWMGFKFGGLVECCETGVIVGDIGRQIIQSIPEDITQPGLPRAYYNAHGHVGDLVVEAQRAVSQVAFSTNPSGFSPLPISQPAHLTSQGPPTETPILPTPSLGSELTLGVTMYSPPPGPPPGHVPGHVPASRRVPVDEPGTTPPAQPPPQAHSLPTKKEPEPAPTAPSLSVGSAAIPLSLSVPYDNGVTQTDENQSLMASIADALSQSHRGFSLEEATPTDSPKRETLAFNTARSVQSEPHGPVATTNGHAGMPRLPEEKEGPWHRRATRRSTSPPSLPPGAAPAAVRAWDDGMGGQGEDDTRSDRPASSSARVPFQRPTSSSERDGEEEEDYASDRKSVASSMGAEGDGDGKHRGRGASLSGGEAASVDEAAAISDVKEQDSMAIQESLSTDVTDKATQLSRTPSQWRIPRVPPPTLDGEDDDVYYTPPTATAPGGVEGDEDEDEMRAAESAKREVSRAMDELMFTAIASPSFSSGYATPRGPPPQYGSVVSSPAAPSAVQPTMSVGGTLYDSAPPSPSLPLPNPPFANRGRTSPVMEMRRPPVGHHRPTPSLSDLNQRPPSPILPPNPPFANRGRTSPTIEMRRPAVHRLTISDGGLGMMTITAPSPIATGGRAVSPTTSLSGSPVQTYRSPPPEYPRLTPPYSTSLMATSSSSLLSGVGAGGAGAGASAGVSPGGTPRTISAAAFRRQQGRVPSGPGPGTGTETTLGPADTSPLMLRKPSGSPLPMIPTASGSVSAAAMVRGPPRAPLSVVNPDPSVSDEEECDPSGESAGYGAGKYVSDLERPPG